MKIAVKIAGRYGEGYRAWCPALPGCSVFANSQSEVRERIRRAVNGYLDHLDETLPRELGKMAKARYTHARKGSHN